MPSTALVTRTPSRRGGPPRAGLTDKGLRRVELLASEGNDQRTIAKELGLAWATFRDLRDRDAAIQDALSRGHGALSDELTHHLLKAARKGNVTAAIYLTKARLGWIEGQAPEGTPTTAVQVNIQIPRAMSDAEFRRVVASANPREGSNGPSPSDDGGSP